MSDDKPWSPADERQLETLWEAGTSTAQIGRLMGRTKNGIVGKAHRVGLPARGSPIVQKSPEERRQRDVDLQQRRAAATARATTREVTRAKAKLTAPATTPGVRCCQWPMWGNCRPGRQPRFCEGPVERGSYCTPHGARAYDKVQLTGPAQERFARVA